ncbi:bile acid:sodium symporter family protein [Cycloclasticus pugetii]|jgi:BASS family bile acid:Na+ symporter|uniref:bile acid:sodium symporter family protein n=1 Tax=Cycloclasticus pugetii TaxID=34068 RepID=UPI00091DB803|nr:bile acid:sodium symporter family protein [Cycloclasticus pugetii]SHI99155.1 bile acid:Na+ symporter, BASS family [Cycloclasticus pugetii]
MISYLVTILLTLLMFGMGLGLTIQDFSRVFTIPKAALAGLIGQLIMLPLLGFILCYTLNLSGAIAIGIMLLTLCPGGVLSNMFTLIARGDLALSVTMTSISSLITVFTLPVILNLSMIYFNDETIQLSLPLLKTASQIMLITVIPVSCGMLVLQYAPRFAKASKQWVRRGCGAFLPFLIVGIFMQNGGSWFEHFVQVGLLTICLNILSILLGYGIAKLAKLERPQTKTLSIEVGAQNAMLGVTIAISPFLLNNADVAMVPSIYGVTMVIILWLYALTTSRVDRLQKANI